ncbi:MAG: YfbM family protein [Phycisphaeraceae bacterium]
MGCLGVHFALDEKEVLRLTSLSSDEARLEHLSNDLEEDYFESQPHWLAQSDKAWDAIHRSLTDGRMGWDNGTFPLSHVIMGGQSLYRFDDYIIVLKTPKEVTEIAAALTNVKGDEFRRNYFQIDPDDCGFPINQDDYEYTWRYFQDVRDLYLRAAHAGRYVLFTASQ